MGRTSNRYDDGLRAFMLSVYNRMIFALALTAAFAFISTISPLAELIHGVGSDGKPTFTIIGLVVAVSPIAVMLLGMLTGHGRTPVGSAFVLYLIAGLFGLSLGSITYLYTATSISTTFLITAGAFAGLSIFGYTTKINLGAIGSMMVMALVGLIILMVVNLFMQSSMMELLLCVAGLGIFSVLTAWDTQKLKTAYQWNRGDTDALAVEANHGALNLYLDFLNIFLFLLKLLGTKK